MISDELRCGSSRSGGRVGASSGGGSSIISVSSCTSGEIRYSRRYSGNITSTTSPTSSTSTN